MQFVNCLISVFRKKAYVVIKFQKVEFGRQHVEVVPRKWLFDNDNSVHWPNKSPNENSKLIRDMSEVECDWIAFECEVITDSSK